MFVTCLILARVMWGVSAQRRLDAAVAAIEAAGDPIHLDDYRLGSPFRPEVPDADNAAYHLRDALAKWPRLDDGTLLTDSDWYQHYGDGPRPPDPITDNAAYVQSLDPALEALREAAKAPAAEWDVEIRGPADGVLLPHLGERRHFARLVIDAIDRAVAAGETARALEMMRLLIDTSPAVNAAPPTLIGSLIHISILAMAVDSLQEHLPQLQLPPERDHLARKQAEALLDRLADDGPLIDSYARGFLGERWMVHDLGLAIADGREDFREYVDWPYLDHAPESIAPLIRLISRPVLVGDVVFALDHLILRKDTVVATGTIHDHRAAVDAPYPGGFDAMIQAQPHWHPVSASLLPAFGASTRVFFQILARQRLAAAALAIKLYEVDHGSRPGALAELVPEYLPAVPVDPWDPAAGPIRYAPGGAALDTGHPEGSRPHIAVPAGAEGSPAVVYSLGVDGLDQGGTVYVTDDGEFNDSAMWREGADIVFVLDPLPPLPASP